jgi:signal transduction histidine kinase/CheY-like chemotaxis protein
MPIRIFESIITLNFLNSSIQKGYNEKVDKNIKKRTIIFLTILLALNITNAILYYFYHSELFLFYFLKLWAYTLTGIISLLLLTSIFCKSKTVLKPCIYISYFLSYYTHFIMRAYFGEFVKVDEYFLAVMYTIQSLYTFSWYFTGILDFFPGLILTICKIISLYLTFGFFIAQGRHFRFAISAFVYLSICFLAYNYILETKKSFFYLKLMEIKKNYYQNILENMNSGFLCIRGNKVNFINKALQSNFNIQIPKQFINDNTSGLGLEQESLSGVAVRNLLKEILNDVELANSVRESIGDVELTNWAKESVGDGQPVVEAIISYLRTCSLARFCIIGTSRHKTSESTFAYYEISARYHITSSNEEENIEFIFNDVTNIKNKEDITAEFKYKTMFLSKVAHEFKNPILSITELVEELSEQIIQVKDTNEELSTNLNMSRINDTLTSIKSMSNYMIILIKDMDFFSRKNQNISNIKLEKEFVKVESIVSFIRDITNILIKRLDKQNLLTFKIEQSNAFPTQIYTDELRLKEILINLLSNSVKYTMHGEIVLEILFENNNLTFIVKDTGMGIPENKRSSLFQPFMQAHNNNNNNNNDNNNVSAGLGLFIVKEMLGLFGSTIEYEPNQSIGSKFKFSLVLENNENRLVFSSKSQKTNRSNPSQSLRSNETIVADYQPKVLPHFRSLFYNYKDKNHEVVLNSISLSVDSLNMADNDITKSLGSLIVVDDENVNRKSTIRLLLNYCSENGKHIKILEAGDGIECLNLYYQCFREGVNVIMIISDQSMTFLNGSEAAKLIHNINRERGIPDIPFFILTAYDGFVIEDGVKDTFTKPVTKKNIEDMLSSINF